MKDEPVVTVDVRDDVRQGRGPFGRIMQVVGGLNEDQDLRLIAPFEPQPLFGVLAQHGFTYESRPLGDGDWEVIFTRRPEAAPTPAPLVEVDARGQEPPQPLVTILEAVATLPAGKELLAYTDRRPMHLYSQLESRGFQGLSREQADGSFVTHIRRS